MSMTIISLLGITIAILGNEDQSYFVIKAKELLEEKKKIDEILNNVGIQGEVDVYLQFFGDK